MKFSPRLGLLLLLLAAGLAVFFFLGRVPRQSPNDVKGVCETFEGCRSALLQGRASVALGYFSHTLDDYYARINSSGPTTGKGGSLASSQADQLVRASLDHCLPNRPPGGPPLVEILQRVLDRKLIDPRAIEGLEIGQIVVKEARGQANLSWEGHMLPVGLSFVKEGGKWKIDLLALLPDAEMALQVDRIIQRQNEEEQIQRLVNPLPLL